MDKKKVCRWDGECVRGGGVAISCAVIRKVSLRRLDLSIDLEGMTG